MEYSSKHCFALFYAPSTDWQESNQTLITITQQEMVHRMYHVLRLNPDDQIILFNRNYHFLLNLIALSKKEIKASLREVKKNSSYHPAITAILPLLKRDALERALDGLTQVGVTAIQLVTTKKSQQHFSDKDRTRLYRIIYAAAEQSKNFSFPELLNPLPLTHWLTTIEKEKKSIVFCDPDGSPVNQVMNTLQRSNENSIIILIGPEGDLTGEEKNVLKNVLVFSMALTPTILRSEQAICLASGIVRALL